MCRSIKPLRRRETETTTGEIEAAARRVPSNQNAEAFDAAIADVAIASRRTLEALGVEIVEGPDRWTPGSGSSRRAQASEPHAHPHPHAATAG